jgi:hypothetical protein
MTSEHASFERYRKGYRRIHMDCHNPDFVTDIGHNLDAKAYVKTLKDAAINSLVTFAKCHHGNCYYPTELGHRHPALDRDMLGSILTECQNAEIDTFIYYSVAWDKHIELQNPEWLCRDKHGEPIAHEIWNFICLNSPYKREVAYPQLKELLRMYGDKNVLGYWLDMCWMPPEGCYCPFCQRKFRLEYGYDLSEAGDADRLAFVSRSVHDFIEEVKRVIKAEDPALLVAHNQIWLTGRPLYVNPQPHNLRVGEYDDQWYVNDFMVTETTLETLFDASINSRYFRGFGLPFEVLLTRFVASWGSWDTVPEAHLTTLVAEIASNGGVASCGDQGFSDGTLDTAVYELIGRAMRTVQEREAWFLNKQEAANICILADRWDESFRGAAHMLMQAQIPFALRDYQRAVEQGLSAFDLVIVPGMATLNEATRTLLADYVQQGGKLFASPATGGVLDETTLRDVFGVQYAGLSPYSMGYFDMTSFAEDFTLFGSPLLVERPFTEFLAEGARTAVQWKMPRVESTGRRYWRHPNAPPGGVSEYPAVTIHELGSGEALLIVADIFADYWTKKHWYLKPMFETLLKQFGVRPVAKLAQPSSFVELNATKDHKALQIHLITFQELPRTLKTGLIGDNPPVNGLVLEIAAGAVDGFREIVLEPSGMALEWERKDDHIIVALPEIQGYEVVEVR